MKINLNIFVIVTIIQSGFIFKLADGQCMLPFHNGTWISSSHGTWIIPENRSEIQNFPAALSASGTIHILECKNSTGNQYILGTKTGFVLFGTTIFSYTCMEIHSTEHSPAKYEYYFITGIDVATGEPFQTDLVDVCAGAVNTATGRAHILIAKGTDAETIKVVLPNVIRGDYNVTVTDQNGATGNQTILGSCNDTSAFYFTKIVNATQSVSHVGYSASGVLYCMKTFTSNDVTYIYALNNDSTVNSGTTRRFACWAVGKDTNSSAVYATVYPDICQDSQNATYVPSGGQRLVLVPSITCPSIEAVEDKNTRLEPWQIALIVLGCVIFIAIIVLIVVLCVRQCKMRDLAKPIPENVDDSTESTTKAWKGGNRPLSSNDLDSARLIEEKKKKKMAKQKPTRTIAVQASIWTQPIMRTTTALKAGMKRSTSESSMKFIPYVKEAVIISPRLTEKNRKEKFTPGMQAKQTPRSNTTLEPTSSKTDRSLSRSKTTVEKNAVSTKAVPKYLTKKKVTTSPRENLLKEISAIKSKTVDHFAYEFEKNFPFPKEGNSKEFHDTIGELDNKNEAYQGKSDQIVQGDEHVTVKCYEQHRVDENLQQTDPSGNETPKETVHFEEKTQEHEVVNTENENNVVNTTQEANTSLKRRELTKTSLRSRPASSDVIIGLNTLHISPVRKAVSEQSYSSSKSILKFSYNSPYAMSDAQKEYLFKKGAWVRTQVRKKTEQEGKVEEMRRLENQRAFDKWMKNKKKSIKRIKRRLSKKSSLKAKQSEKSTVNDSNINGSIVQGQEPPDTKSNGFIPQGTESSEPKQLNEAV